MTQIDLSIFENADRAGEHPNGPIVLIKNRPDGGEDRLHWWTDDHNNWSNRHNHRWSFNSSILCGELEEELYTVIGEGGFRNDIHLGWVDMGPVEWNLRLSDTIKPGFNPSSSRYLQLDQFHRVRAVKETITLVETEPAKRTWSRVLPQLPGDDTKTGPFKPYDVVEARQTLKWIETKLKVSSQ